MEQVYNDIQVGNEILFAEPFSRTLAAVNLKALPYEVGEVYGLTLWFLLPVDHRKEVCGLWEKLWSTAEDKKAFNQAEYEFIKLHRWGWHNKTISFLSSFRNSRTSKFSCGFFYNQSTPAEYRFVKLLFLAVNIIEAHIDIHNLAFQEGFKAKNKYIKSLADYRALPFSSNGVEGYMTDYLPSLLRGYDGDSFKPIDLRWKYLYLMQSTTEHYKIGVSANPHKRLRQLNSFPTILPLDIRLIYAFRCENAFLAEKQLHQECKTKRYKGEWFSLDQNFIDWFCSIQTFDLKAGFVPRVEFHDVV